MTEQRHWTFVADPVQNLIRLTEGERIIGVVATEEDAKLICDAVNSLPPGDQVQSKPAHP